jgi:tRNA (guanine-N7-)-methyltransferase
MPRPLPLSIADWLIPWRERTWPLPLHEEFGRETPLALEIGFGNGEFLEREARGHPERDHVGIELSWTSATHLFRRLDKGGPTNVRVLLADAEVALRHVFAPASLVEVFVNHPCPWPKDRHAARRLVRPEVLRLLATRMAAGAPLLVVTDHAEYAVQIAEVLEGQEDFAPQHGATEVAEIPGREPTKYQRKAMAEGIPIHYFPWVRVAGGEPAAEASEEVEMPSLTLNGSVPPETLFAGFEPDVETTSPDGVPTVVKLVSAYQRVDREGWLVEALVKEDRLQQDFAIEVVPRGEERLLVKVSHLGHAHPTFGVKRAVWRVGRWLWLKHPELGLEHHNLGAAAEPA